MRKVEISARCIARSRVGPATPGRTRRVGSGASAPFTSRDSVLQIDGGAAQSKPSRADELAKGGGATGRREEGAEGRRGGRTQRTARRLSHHISNISADVC